MQATVFNPAQIELLRMMSFVKTDTAMKELKGVIAQYFAQKAKETMDEMWRNGEMDMNKFNSFRTLHERTPYRKAKYAKHRA